MNSNLMWVMILKLMILQIRQFKMRVNIFSASADGPCSKDGHSERFYTERFLPLGKQG